MGWRQEMHIGIFGRVSFYMAIVEGGSRCREIRVRGVRGCIVWGNVLGGTVILLACGC